MRRETSRNRQARNYALRDPRCWRCYLAKIRAWQRGAQFAPDIAFADTDVVHDARAILALDEWIASLDGEHATELDADGRAMNGSASGCRRQCYDDRLALPRYL